MCEGKTGNQERNIMIMFLSNYHGFKYDDYKEAKIVGEGAPYTIFGSNSVKCVETNEAPLKDIQVYIGKPLDAIFYFATKAVRNLPTKKRPIPKETPIKMYLHKDDDQAKPFKSDEEFFWKVLAPRVLGENFRSHTKLIPVPFNEDDDDPIQSSIMAATAMKEAINDYLGEAPVSCCRFYADITGGPRPANMAMSAVMQLLQYEDARLERVVYSDLDFRKVSNMQPINDLYLLVAGVDAFTKYGRSDTIEKYFNYEFSTNGKENKPKNKLENLLAAMHRFADAMSLCWPDHILKGLTELIKALEDYSVERNDPKERLLFQLLPTIQDKYKSLFIRKDKDTIEIDRLAVIGWCNENKLIQQALTFCTEWLPQYIVDYGALYSDDSAVQKYCKEQNKSGEKITNGKKFFIKEFSTKKPPNNDTLRTIQENASKAAINALLDGKETEHLNPPFRAGELPAFLRSIPERLHAVRNGNLSLNVNALQNQHDKFFVGILREITQTKKVPFCLETVRMIKVKAIRAQLKKYTKTTQIYWDIFQAGSEKYQYQKPNIPKYMDTSEKAMKVFEAMLRCGLAKTIFAYPGQSTDFRKATEYIRQYTYIRANIRNTTNHALTVEESKKNSPQNFIEVKKALEDCLALIKDLVNDKRAIAHKAKNVWPDTPKKEQEAAS